MGPTDDHDSPAFDDIESTFLLDVALAENHSQTSEAFVSLFFPTGVGEDCTTTGSPPL